MHSLVTGLWREFILSTCLYCMIDCCCCSVAQLCPTLCDPMNCSTPGFPTLHHFLRLAQTHIHWVGNTIQLSHPLSSHSPPAFNIFQHQGLFKWVSSSHQMASIGASASASVFLMIIQDWFPLGWTGWISLQSKGLSRVFYNTTAQKHQFFVSSFLYGSTLTSIHDDWEKNIALTRQTFVSKVLSLLFNMLSSLVMAFLPRSMRLLTSRL